MTSPDPQPDPQPEHAPGADPTTHLLEQLEAGLTQQFLRATAIDPRLRRFARAVADLGLPVPADWAVAPPDPSGRVEFGSLSWGSFDRLVRLLEDLAGQPVGRAMCAPGGATLFNPGPAPAPIIARPPSTVHIQVPR